METIGFRIGELIKQSGLTHSEFAERISTSNATISHILKGRNKPSLQIILQVKQSFTNVNIDYLLTGKGELFIQELSPAVASDLPLTGHGATTFPIEGVRKVNVSGAPVAGLSEPEVEADLKDAILEVKTESKPISKPDTEIEKILILYTDGHFEVFKP